MSRIWSLLGRLRNLPGGGRKMDQRVSHAVLTFLNDRKAPLVARPPKGLTDTRLDDMARSLMTMIGQVKRWPQRFADMDEVYKEIALDLFKTQAPNMDRKGAMPPGFLELMFDGFKKSDADGRTDDRIASAYGLGPSGLVYALTILSLLFAAHEAAETTGVDKRSVLGTVAGFLAGLKFERAAIHAGALMEAIEAELPARLEAVA